MSSYRFVASSLLVAGSILAAGAAHASVTFTDHTFAGYVLGFAATPAGTSFSQSQCASCGVGGSAGLELVLSDTGTGLQAAAAVINPLFTYDPTTQGTISSITASVDKNFLVQSTTNSYGNSFRPVIEQGGSFYTALLIPGFVSGDPAGGVTSSGYQSFTLSNLTADKFGRYDTTTGTVDMSQNPDFAGSAITFGIGQYVAPAARPNTTLTSDFDNLTIQVQTAVPEPAAWAMMIGGIGLVGGAMRRRRTTVRFA